MVYLEDGTSFEIQWNVPKWVRAAMGSKEPLILANVSLYERVCSIPLATCGTDVW